jgi:hypothetical protein
MFQPAYQRQPPITPKYLRFELRSSSVSKFPPVREKFLFSGHRIA